jgi:KaiC/GvpD/RAD55 family RecA-like ATPase
MKEDEMAPFNIYDFVSRYNVTCFCSAPGIGKTLFLMNLMNSLSKKEKVTYISLGSTRHELHHLQEVKETLVKDNNSANNWHIQRLRYVKHISDLIDQIVEILTSDQRPKTLIIDDLSSFPLLVQEDGEYSAPGVLEQIVETAEALECKIVFALPIRFSKVKTPIIQFRHWLYMDGGIGSADLSDAVIFLDREGYYGDARNRRLLHGQIAQARDPSLLHHTFELSLPLLGPD